MAAAVFFLEALFLAGGAPHLTPFIVPENALIAMRKKLERLFYFLHVVKLHGAVLVKDLKIRRVDKVAHQNAVHWEAEVFHRVSAFIGVHPARADRWSSCWWRDPPAFLPAHAKRRR